MRSDDAESVRRSAIRWAVGTAVVAFAWYFLYEGVGLVTSIVASIAGAVFAAVLSYIDPLNANHPNRRRRQSERFRRRRRQ